MSVDRPATDPVARASAVFTAVLGVAPARGLLTTPDEVEGWDSLNQIRLAHALEQEFGRLLPEDLLLRPGSFGELIGALGDQR